jgi:hypothetical protein
MLMTLVERLAPRLADKLLRANLLMIPRPRR